ncbi:MAG: GNAT family N-acetyltransferase [Potamolinea sp.]
MTDRSSLLPSGCTLRHASAKDIWRLRKLVFSEKLDPTQLRWQQFWVIECEAELVACGQLRNFSGTQELSSLVVVPAWRQRGLGTYLTTHLIQEATEPLYLECLGEKLAIFYTRFGFVPVSWQDVPSSLKFKFALPQLGRKILGISVTIMHYQELPSK